MGANILAAIRDAFLALLSQHARLIDLDLADADDAPVADLMVERFEAQEALSQPFGFEIDCLCTTSGLELKRFVGQRLRLRLLLADGGHRAWHGYVTAASSLGADGGLARYRLRMEPWLAYLRLRRNSRIFQDADLRDIASRLFAEYPQADFRFEVTQPLRKRAICTQHRESDLEFLSRLLADEGLAYRFEHVETAPAEASGHTLVIYDTQAETPQTNPATLRFHRAAATEAEDGVTAFAAQLAAVSNASVVSGWDRSQLVAPAGSAQADAGNLPTLELHDGARHAVYADADTAGRIAELRLAAAQQSRKTFAGASSVRALQAGAAFTLVEHPDLSGTSFVPFSVTHYAANNLGAEVAKLLAATDIEAGSYRNTFECVSAGTPVLAPYLAKPTAPGATLAVVVGLEGEPLTSTRDHEVRVQFPWQRGAAPLPGGASDTGNAADEGHAPGNESSGTWVRVAEALAGSNWGASFTSRVGTQVLVQFLDGDLDQPVIVGSLYTGEDTPPFAAGIDSAANHPGVLSGLHTQTLDGAETSQFVQDDAPGQLRTRLATTRADSELNLGYLVDQSGSIRGAFRGEGFELTSAAWSVVRAPQGLLLSATARPSGTSTQMDATEAVGQLQAAQDRAKALSDAATQAQASALGANSGQTKLVKALDPQQDAKYTEPANGQDANKPSGAARSGGDPVERFAVPAVLMDSPSAIAWATPKSLVGFAGGHTHLTVIQDAQMSAGATLSSVSGRESSLFTRDGGLTAVAANGPLSLQAHGEALEVLADQSVTVTSTSDSIEILASTKIVLQAGQSSVTLDGQNITFAMPGNFTVKGSLIAWMGAQSDVASLPRLPEATPAEDLFGEQFRLVAEDGETPLAGREYKITSSDGQTWVGITDDDGLTERISTAVAVDLLLEVTPGKAALEIV